MGRPREFDEDRILAAATDLFWEKGFEGTSISDLEERLGVGRQSLYATFGDKRQLLVRALDHYASRQPAQRAPLLRPDAGLDEIREFFDGLVAFLTAEPRRSCLLVNSALDAEPGDTAVASRCGANERNLARAFEHALRGARAQGALRDDLDIRAAALVLVSHTFGLNVMARNGGQAAMLRRVAQLAVRSLEP